MFEHKDVWRGIDRLANAFGYSPSGLAKKAGLDPTSFNKSKRISPDGKPRWPSTESLSKILAVTGATMGDFIDLIGADEVESVPTAVSIPVIGFAQAGEKGFFDEQGYPKGGAWNEINLPSLSSEDNGLYALEISGDSMAPLYRKGDLIIVDPAARIRKGDRIIAKTRGGEVIAKELVRKSTDEVVLKSMNKNYEDRVFKPKDLHWLARVIWVSQ